MKRAKNAAETGIPKEQVSALGRAVGSNAVLRSDQVAVLKQVLLGALGPSVSAAFASREPMLDDLIRLKPLATRCRAQREELGYSIQEVARLCGVPQYRIKAIEACRVGDILLDVLELYVTCLSLVGYWRRWRRQNGELVGRLAMSQAAVTTRRGRGRVSGRLTMQ
jgi:hypothetical protein